MNTFNKDFYMSPTVSVVEVKTEGMICSSEIEAEGEGFITWED